jgi:hypothetical protein
MIDTTTKKPLRVLTDGTAGPYIMVPLDQLEEVKHALDNHSIRYWVEENAISLNKAPFIAVIDLGRNGDTKAVQAILDKVQ